MEGDATPFIVVSSPLSLSVLSFCSLSPFPPTRCRPLALSAKRTRCSRGHGRFAEDACMRWLARLFVSTLHPSIAPLPFVPPLWPSFPPMAVNSWTLPCRRRPVSYQRPSYVCVCVCVCVCVTHLVAMRVLHPETPSRRALVQICFPCTSACPDRRAALCHVWRRPERASNPARLRRAHTPRACRSWPCSLYPTLPTLQPSTIAHVAAALHARDTHRRRSPTRRRRSPTRRRPSPTRRSTRRRRSPTRRRRSSTRTRSSRRPSRCAVHHAGRMPQCLLFLRPALRHRCCGTLGQPAHPSPRVVLARYRRAA